jgi:hypothetical protein
MCTVLEGAQDNALKTRPFYLAKRLDDRHHQGIAEGHTDRKVSVV